jgi:HlyD family secretion protein
LLLSTVLLAVIALACALAPRIGWLASEAQPAGGEALEASGIIRAEEVLIASEWGGQIAAIPVGEGDSVAVGDVVVQLDTALLDAQIKAARAAVALAETGLAQAKAGARPGQIAVAEAQLAQTEAARLAAMQAVSDTLTLVENPQEVRLQIAVKQAQAEAAQHHVARAMTIKDAAAIGKDKFESMQGKWYEGGHRKVLIDSGPVSELPDVLPPEIVVLLPTLGDGVHNFGELELHLHGETYDLYARVNVRDIPIPFELHLMPNQWWQAWVGINAAVAQQEGIEASLAHLYAQQARPQGLEAMADEALASLAQAEAQIAAAQARVDGLKAGPTEEQIAALEARVVQAQARLDSLSTRRRMMTLVSPVDGTVVNMVAHPGEVAVPGASLLTVVDLGQVNLVVYVPETALGRVRLGQRVGVSVDSFEGRIFEGQVTHIADRAEFRPRNVATREERANLVFAVEIQLANDDRALKPGMPADAVFGE